MWILYWIGLRASQALAAAGPKPQNPNDGISIANPLKCEEATECIEGILQALLKLAIPVVAIMVLVGGFQLMASAGNEEKVKKGRDTILYAIIGFAVIILATGVAAIINDIVSGGAATAP